MKNPWIEAVKNDNVALLQRLPFNDENPQQWEDALLEAASLNKMKSLIWLADFAPLSDWVIFQAGTNAARAGHEDALEELLKRVPQEQRQTLINEALLGASENLHIDLMDSLRPYAERDFMEHIAYGAAFEGKQEIVEYYLLHLPPTSGIPVVITGATSGNQGATLGLLAQFLNEVYEQNLGTDLAKIYDWKALELLAPYIDVKPVMQTLNEILNDTSLDLIPEQREAIDIKYQEYERLYTKQHLQEITPAPSLRQRRPRL